jgi:FkbM family methyltransferase
VYLTVTAIPRHAKTFIASQPVSASTTAITLARRTIRSSPVARTLLRTPALRRAICIGRAAWLLRPAGHFLLGETRAGVVGRYAIRGAANRIVHLRHGSRDVEIFNEIFSPARISYEPPAEISAVLSMLGPLRIGDLGGNIGLFGVYALERWNVQTLRSFEPDPANAALLRATLTANGADQRWELVQAAVSNEARTALLEAGLHSESRLVETAAAQTIEVPVVDLFLEPSVDLLKIDIEGAEWSILADPRLASYPARAIVVEWHRRMCPRSDPRSHARELLANAGYEVFDGESSATLANGVMWGVRRH